MLTEQEAQQLMTDLIKIRDEIKLDPNNKILKSDYSKIQNKCLDKFKYLVTMRTSRYKTFSNYDDLNQEGYQALTSAMANYKPTKGSFFWWAHKYIDTRIARSANLHTTIRFPLKFAKETAPHKESELPTLIEESLCPDKEVEMRQVKHAIDSSMASLTDQQKQIINLEYGLDGDKPLSINKICKRLNISRSMVIKERDAGLESLKNSIKL